MESKARAHMCVAAMLRVSPPSPLYVRCMILETVETLTRKLPLLEASGPWRRSLTIMRSTIAIYAPFGSGGKSARICQELGIEGQEGFQRP
ncbi:hypothetical protein P7K49_029998 [Saguinus oedipus]|uniref:Uncharacterized protein n=1 Tax=Saguinus oedipus TaxID=9490 RepID=A0ABQ9U8T3_SAGOE|nr:hypothetical protein P7K49_029998 [Saguinus oedipus]